MSFIYGINYERHGVTFNFPPEVKLESRSHFTYKFKNLNISLIYENEYFEHYGFVDKNINVWTEAFEEDQFKGLIQSYYLLSIQLAINIQLTLCKIPFLTYIYSSI